ncbi:hypothetical protein PLICRDRAFT_616451 [Plicaturopsis crispa FD-325 SS-3]|nr:hypothetical protein PLICRDRAFT_616451 [Plicaturopsis crispa FD-325 SS-3]
MLHSRRRFPAVRANHLKRIASFESDGDSDNDDEDDVPAAIVPQNNQPINSIPNVVSSSPANAANGGLEVNGHYMGMLAAGDATLTRPVVTVTATVNPATTARAIPTIPVLSNVSTVTRTVAASSSRAPTLPSSSATAVASSATAVASTSVASPTVVATTSASSSTLVATSTPATTTSSPPVAVTSTSEAPAITTSPASGASSSSNASASETASSNASNVGTGAVASSKGPSGAVIGVVVTIVVLVVAALVIFFVRKTFLRRRQQRRVTWGNGVFPEKPLTSQMPFTNASAPEPPAYGAIAPPRQSYNNPGTPTPYPMSIVPRGGPAPPANSAVVRCAFVPSLPDELNITLGERVRVIGEYDDGWALCANSRGEQGMVPVECLDRNGSGGPGGEWRGSRRESSLRGGRA